MGNNCGIVFVKADSFVNEALELVDFVEYGFNLFGSNSPPLGAIYA